MFTSISYRKPDRAHRSCISPGFPTKRKGFSEGNKFRKQDTQLDLSVCNAFCAIASLAQMEVSAKYKTELAGGISGTIKYGYVHEPELKDSVVATCRLLACLFLKEWWLRVVLS